MTYDSSQDTLRHREAVQKLMMSVVVELDDRGFDHDKSKLEEPEKPVFDAVTPRLHSLTYGSEEYRSSLAEMGDALAHHYANNRHHPEHFADGVDGMNLIDVCEMVCDWVAASTRHDNGDPFRSLELNTDRFKLSPQLASILRNTIEFLTGSEEKK